MLSMLRWVVSYIAQVKRIYVGALLLMVISVVTNLLITISQKYIIDDIFVQGKYNLFPYYLTLFIAIACAYIASWCLKDILFERASDRLRGIMRRDYMQYMHAMPASQYHGERVGSFVSYLNEFLNSKNVYIWNLPRVIEKLLNLALLVGIVGYVMPELLLVLVPLSVIYMMQGKYFSSRIHKLSVDKNELNAAHNVHIEEGISSTREVVAFHRLQWERSKLTQSFQQYIRKVFDIVGLERKQLYISEPLRWGCNLTILIYGGYQVVQGAISLGTFVVFYQLAVQILDAIQGVYNSALQFAGAYGGMHKAQQLLQGEQVEPGDIVMTEPIRGIVISKVDFAYQAEHSKVLEGADMTIPAGKKVAFVGESGSGKSTIALLLLRLYEPDQGRIEVNGIPLSRIARQSWASSVHAVFQDPYLFPDTIRSNIMLGREYSQAELETACRLAEIHDMIIGLTDGYETLLGERGVTLSGGQRQRIALARAIIGNPEVLILDEATSALDLETERRVQANIDALRKGKTTIVIAHRLSTVENADIRYTLKSGKVVVA